MTSTQAHADGPAIPKRTAAFPPLTHFIAEYLLALPLGAALALAWVTSAPEHYFRVAQFSSFFVNNVLMVFFFALVTKEVAEAMAPGGVLHPWRRAALPIVASGPTAILCVGAFALAARLFDEPVLERGWAAAIAIDIALGYFIVRLVFGRRAAVPFFIVTAVAANGIGFIAIALSEPLTPVRPWLALAFAGSGLATAFILRLQRVRSVWPYMLAAGGLTWIGCYAGGLPAALALVPIVFFMPGAQRDPGFFVDAKPGSHTTLDQLERVCRFPAQLALFLFGVVNAGVIVRSVEPGVWALPLAVLVARPLGLLIGVAVGKAARLHLPADVGWRELLVIGVAASGGFAMALFFATATVGAGSVLAELKVGALISAVLALAAIPLASALHVGRFTRRPAK
jgi:NhaA family Na+:H+ antiporter